MDGTVTHASRIARHDVEMWLAALAGFLLTWQTVGIIRPGVLGGAPWPLATIGVYASDIVLSVGAMVGLSRAARQYRDRVPIRYAAAPRRGRLRFGMGTAMLAGYTLAVVNTIVSADPWLSVVGWLRLLALPLALVGFPRALGWRHAFLSGFLIAVLGHALLGIIQFALQEVPASTLLGIAHHAPWVRGDAVVETATGRWLRAYGGFPHPNVLGTALLVGFIAAMSFVRERSAPFASQSVLRASALLLPAAIVLSFSRAAWLGFIVLLVILAHRTETRRLAVVSGAVFAVLLALAGPLVLPRVTASGRLETRAMAERRSAIADARALLARPRAVLVGVGLHAMPQMIIRSDSGRAPFTAQPVHGVPLLALVEIGVLGVIAMAIVIVGSYRRWRDSDVSLHAPRFAPSLALLPSFLFDHHLWSLPVGLALFLALVVTTSLDPRPQVP